MRIARAIDSLPQLRRQLVPTVRSRVERGRLISTGVDQPTQGGFKLGRTQYIGPVSRTRQHRYPHLRVVADPRIGCRVLSSLHRA